MTRPLVAIIAGACVVITIVIAVRHFGGEERDEVAARTRVAALAAQSIGERGGWSAKPGPSGDAADARGSAAAPGSGTAASASSGTGGRDSNGNFTTSSTRGGATVITGERGGGGTFGVSGSRAPAPGGSSIRLSAPEAAVKFEGAGPHGGGRGDQMVLANVPAEHSADPNKPVDENDPVLSLPLDHSVEPEKGDAPLPPQGITFDSGAGAKFAADAQFVVPNAGGLTGESGTISFNLQNEWTGSDATDATLMKIRNPNEWQDRIEITKNGQYLRFVLADDTGTESGVGVPINWQPNEQHQLQATWEDGVMTFYVDGRSVGQASYPGPLVFRSGTPLYIGSDVPGGQGGARGTISDVKLYNRVSPPS